jgi:Dolichyl-phosphate-mannose-protein mannosyltransferase
MNKKCIINISCSSWVCRPDLVLLIAVGAIIASWGLIFGAIPANKQGFPLNDDWAYSKGAFAFARGDGIHYYRQPSMPLLGQWLLAYPVIRIAGESHAALRLLTITLSVFGVWAFYDLMRREAGASGQQAGFAAASLAFNPIFFVMSGTFMSDVPALSLSLVALAFYTRALNEERFGALGAGAVVATLATMTRQNAVVTSIVAGILLWRHRTLRWAPCWLAAIWLPAIAGVLAHFWFAARPDSVPLGPRFPSWRLSFALCYITLHYLGLTVLPLLALRPGVVSWPLLLPAMGAMLYGAAVYQESGASPFQPTVSYAGLFPYLENIITPWGVLEDGLYVVGKRPLMMGWGMLLILTAGGVVGGSMLVERSLRRLAEPRRANALSLFTFLHALLLLVSPTLFDRYLLVLMPGAIAIATVAPLHVRWKIGVGMLALFVACSIGLMHDWLAWNSARWELGRRALTRGLRAADIEGGLEWDSWHAPGPVSAERAIEPPRGLTLPFNHNRFPHIQARYALAFSSVPGTIVLDSEPYRLWLIPYLRSFLLLKQADDLVK